MPASVMKTVANEGTHERLAGYGLRVAGYELRVAGCGLRVTSCGLRVVINYGFTLLLAEITALLIFSAHSVGSVRYQMMQI